MTSKIHTLLNQRALGVTHNLYSIREAAVVALVLLPVLGDHVDGLGVQQRLRVRDGGERGGGRVRDAQPRGVTRVVVRVQRTGVGHVTRGVRGNLRSRPQVEASQ